MIGVPSSRRDTPAKPSTANATIGIAHSTAPPYADDTAKACSPSTTGVNASGFGPEPPMLACAVQATPLRRTQMQTARNAVRLCARASVTGVAFFDL